MWILKTLLFSPLIIFTCQQKEQGTNLLEGKWLYELRIEEYPFDTVSTSAAFDHDTVVFTLKTDSGFVEHVYYQSTLIRTEPISIFYLEEYVFESPASGFLFSYTTKTSFETDHERRLYSKKMYFHLDMEKKQLVFKDPDFQQVDTVTFQVVSENEILIHGNKLTRYSP